MKRKIYTLATVLLIAMLTFSPAFAGGISGAWGLGSIKFVGTAWGFGGDAEISISGSGVPEIACYAPGNDNPAPGQNPARLSATNTAGLDSFDHNKGKFSVDLEAYPDITGYTASQLGCPNDNWSAEVVFVYWDEATLTVVNSKGDVVYAQNFSCVTTHNPDSIICKPAS